MTQNKITIFGDSIAKGIFLNNLKPESLKTNAVNILETSLNQKIENNSKFGQTLKKVFERGIVEKFCKTNHDGEIVVLELGGNDSDFDWARVEKNLDENHQPKTSLKDFENMLEITIKLIKTTGAKVVVCSLCPVDANLYFENVLSKNFDGEKILRFLKGDTQNIYRHQELFNILAMKTAMKNDCLFFDYRFEMLKSTNLKELLCSDGIHPNENGQKLIAKLALEKLELKRKNFLEILTQKANSLDYITLAKTGTEQRFVFKHAFVK